jgi:hypothetical protein
VVHVRAGGRGRVNVAGLVCLRPDDQARLVYRVRLYRGRAGEAKSLTWTDYRDLLITAHRQLKAPIVLVWDNLSTHKVPQLQEFITAHADWLTVFHLPAYAPDLNPVEGIWSTVKAALANVTATDLDHLAKTVRRHLRAVQRRAPLIDGCLTQTRLTLHPP